MLQSPPLPPSRRTFFFRACLVGFALLHLVCSAQAQRPDQVWSPLEASALDRPGKPAWVQPAKHRPVRLSPGLLRAQLARAPRERAPGVAAPAELTLPLPDGGFARFRIVESPVMAPELAARFPEIQTWLGQGIDDPSLSMRADWTPAGFHAQILSPRGSAYIDPLWRDDATEYAVYRKGDLGARGDGFVCLTAAADGGGGGGGAPADLLSIGGTLRTYRLACAATGEYTAFHGGTVAGAQAAIVTAVNRVVGVYEVELGIRLVLIGNNSSLIYTDGATDPYTNDTGDILINENQSNVDLVIGSANYDIGHVFSTGGGGIAGLGVVCVNGQKARGVTGRTAPVGDAFYIDYVAHEMGHQFGGTHTFNSVTSNCGGGNRSSGTAYEPGSGTTIMAYAGICGADNVQPNSDPYFLFASQDQIVTYITTGSGAGCAVATATGNNPPAVSAGPNYTIPAGTPFALTATGSDPDGDPLTFCWEERDLGGSQLLTDPDNGLSPLFRSFNPTNSPTRTFPKLSALLANTASVAERLPTTSRTLKFRVTARDNRAGGGGVAAADMQLTVAGGAGPFVVTAPNTAVVWSNAQTVTWNPAGTASAPVNCTNVNIRLSADGGNTFPYLLAANTPNDGAELIVLPNITTTQARIKVEGASNVFFDVSNTDFTVLPGEPVPLLTLESATLAAESCAPGNGGIDPGEFVTVNVALRNIGNGSASNLVATLRATNGVTAPGAPQNYGVLSNGAPAVTRPFTFTASGPCAGTITCVFDLTDGTNDLGTVQRSFVLGAYAASSVSRTNSSLISIPANGNQGSASPYPSTLVVSNFPGIVTKVTARLAGLTHTYPDDLDILLVGPGGQKVMLMSDAGGNPNLSNVNLVFDDAAANSLNDSTQITSGTYRPTDYEAGETMNSPAPAGPYGTALAAFNGASPNGTWSLYIQDDSSQDTGSLASWSLTINGSNLVCCAGPPISDLSVTAAATPNPVVLGGTVTLALVVSNNGPAAAPGVWLTNPLPAGFNFVSATSTQGGVTNAGGVISAALGTLGAGASATVNLSLTATNIGAWTNAVVVGGAALDPAAANNTNLLVLLVPADFDADGIADAWELGNGLSPTNAADAALDLDGDGFTALQEFLAGTDPNDARNFLGIVSVNLVGADGVIEFTSVAGRAYDVELTDGWPPAAWLPVLTNVPGTGANLLVTNLGAATTTNRVYRVRLVP